MVISVLQQPTTYLKKGHSSQFFHSLPNVGKSRKGILTKFELSMSSHFQDIAVQN